MNFDDLCAFDEFSEFNGFDEFSEFECSEFDQFSEFEGFFSFYILQVKTRLKINFSSDREYARPRGPRSR